MITVKTNQSTSPPPPKTEWSICLVREGRTYQARKTPDTWSLSSGCDLAGHSSNQEVRPALASSEGHSCVGGNESGTAAAVWVALFHNHASRTQKINKLKSRKIPIIPSHLIHKTLWSAWNFNLICTTLYMAADLTATIHFWYEI